MSKKFTSFYSVARRRAGSHGADSMFGWTIFIFLLMGFALFCWMGSFYIFGHPEKASNYRLLKRLHKLEEPQRFEITAAPRGEFLKPGQLLERFGHLAPPDMEQTNGGLLRNFLRNYHQTHDLVPYAVGTYKVLAAFPLTEKNFFYPGMVALLQAIEQPEILLEQAFTSDIKNLSALEKALQSGQEIKLEKPSDLSAIIFSERLSDGRIKLTTMPLLYGTYGAKQDTSSFSLEPPSQLNIEAGLPLLTKKEIASADEQYADYREKMGLSKTSKNPKGTATPTTTPSQLARIPLETINPATPSEAFSKKTVSLSSLLPITRLSQVTETSLPFIARAIPVHEPTVLPAIPITSSAIPMASAIPIRQATPVDAPNSSLPLKPTNVLTTTPLPSPTPVATATPTTVSNASATNTLLSFSSPAPPLAGTNMPLLGATPIENTSGGIWATYDPGKMPRGRLVSGSEIPNLATQGLAGERLYLQGNFAVTASGQDRAVLRYQSSVNNPAMGRNAKVRIIVSYPTGTLPPTEGASLTRNHTRPFMITEVKRGEDGTINIYVREITHS
ncbi:MAG: hypothetical protein A3F67_02420 [Verrucomicrobia bacterium RIFCSPHIGHO2_12_FULL_41_10]|nr:MAG: hypothetical protein A3F67_02420 [Verrucomicrobia bacterium RIFCSPHIGHO2_12_FULL_41_10]HLB32943.1 hypothetical protein [Chthoniobacterales bacterium]